MKRALLSVLFMFLVSFFFAALVSSVKRLSRDRIESHQRIKRQRLVLKVLNLLPEGNPSAEDIPPLYQARIREIVINGRSVYIGYEDDGQTVRGYAFPVGGAGFWGPIEGMAAVDPEARLVLGVAFSKHSETPGLGGRITESWFQDQFKGLRLSPVKAGRDIFRLKPSGERRADNELDAITGATNTSRAVESFLNRDLADFINQKWEEAVKRK